MTLNELKKDLELGESTTVEFKSWIKARDMKERISLAVDELIAFANTKGGVLYFGVEDNGVVTGCSKYDCQRIIESIYDRTRPSLFTEIEVIEYNSMDVLAIKVSHDGNTYATTDGKCLKRLGKNSKPYYPEEMSNKYLSNQNPDFSSQIIVESSENDINKLEVYKLKEKLRLRDSESTLPDLEDLAFMRDLGIIKKVKDEYKLTIAGLLFVGKEMSIYRVLPQAEVVYLHYSADNLEEYDARIDMRQPIISILDRLTEKIQNSNKILNVQVGLFRLEVVDFSEKVFQEALLNAIAHRDYQSSGAIYVKHYPDKIIIENPGGFLSGITTNNIITHPSLPRNKLIAETLQRLKYVQRTGQGVDIIYREMLSSGKPYPQYRVYNDAVSLTICSSVDDIDFVKFIAQEQNRKGRMMPLPELMVLRYLVDNKRINISHVQILTQTTLEESRKTISSLMKDRLIELNGKEYMLTPKVYEAIKADVEYTKDKVLQYVKAKNRILDYLEKENYITNEKIRELCGFTKQQARSVVDKMRKEDILKLVDKGTASKYVLKEKR